MGSSERGCRRTGGAVAKSLTPNTGEIWPRRNDRMARRSGGRGSPRYVSTATSGRIRHLSVGAPERARQAGTFADEA